MRAVSLFAHPRTTVMPVSFSQGNAVMAGLGHQRKSAQVSGMSALASIATKWRTSRDARSVPLRDMTVLDQQPYREPRTLDKHLKS
jgi:hypothetical protein